MDKFTNKLLKREKLLLAARDDTRRDEDALKKVKSGLEDFGAVTTPALSMRRKDHHFAHRTPGMHYLSEKEAA